jgi:flagellar biosynthesis protein FlhA
MGNLAVPIWVGRVRLSGDVTLGLCVLLLVVMLVVPLPAWLLDAGLALSITSSVLVLMVALFMRRPLDFTSFPTVLLLSTLLRLALNVATTRAILTSGHEGPEAAGQTISAFGGFLMGGDVVVGMIVFAILLLVNHVVVSKGAGRIAEVAARFSLDAMPGKQMAIDAELSAGTLNEEQARRRRAELEQESAFFGAMDGASKFVKGDAIASLVATLINLLAGMAIGIARHGLPFGEAVNTFSILTIGDGLTGQIPSTLVALAAGIVVTKAGGDARADEALALQLGGPKPLGIAAGVTLFMGLLPGMPFLPFMLLAGGTGYAAWAQWKAEVARRIAAIPPPAPPVEPPASDALKMDVLRLELGYGLLSLASGDAQRLTEQIRTLRRTTALEMGFVLPQVRIQDNLDLPADTYVIRVKEIEVARGQLRPPLHLAIDPSGHHPPVPGDKVTEPTFGLPAAWIEEASREAALAAGCTVVDCTGVLATHLTEILRENMAEMLSFAETQKLVDELAPEHKRLVGDVIPAQASLGTLQRLLQALLAERVSIRDLPTILEGVQEAAANGARSLSPMLAAVRTRLARQISEAARGPDGIIPIIVLSPEWEEAFAESLAGPGEEKQLAMAPARLQAFMHALRAAFDSAAESGLAPVLVCSGGIRAHVRAVVERFRAATRVLSHTEIHARARLRTVGQV